MSQKKTFQLLFLGFALLMVLLPPFAALNSFLTRTLDTAGWYRPIKIYVVPTEARLVAAAILPFGVRTKLTPNSSIATMYMIKDGGALPVDLQWNCLGWQSILLLFASFIAGMRGRFTLVSRLKCVLFGLVGTILINIIRMSGIALGIYYVSNIFAAIVHDYVAALVTLLWLLLFWWFSYSYILEPQQAK